MESSVTNLAAEKTELQRKLRARTDNLCFQQNCKAIAARIAEIDKELAADGG